MNCINIRKLLARYSDGTLPSADRNNIREHLQNCVGCAQELEALKRTAELLSIFTLEEPPEIVRQKVLAGLDDRPKWWFLSLPAAPRWAAAVLVFLVLTGVFISLRFKPEKAPEISMDTTQVLLVEHVAAGWNDPFADRTVLALDMRAPSQP